MNESIINLLVQVPLVGIFAFLMLEVMKRQDVRELKRDEMHAREREERDKREAEERRTRDEAWRAFLESQQTGMNNAISRIAEETKQNTVAIGQMSTILSAHDAASKERSRQQQ